MGWSSGSSFFFFLSPLPLLLPDIILTSEDEGTSAAYYPDDAFTAIPSWFDGFLLWTTLGVALSCVEIADGGFSYD